MKHDIAAERERRGLSVRRAAQMGGVSNTTWARFEAGDTPLTGKMRLAVAEAFGWSTDWPELDQPAPAGDNSDVVLDSLERVTDLVSGISAGIRCIEAQLAANREQMALIAERLDVAVVPIPDRPD